MVAAGISVKQIFKACNTCADCSSGCVNSSAACATFQITLNASECGNTPIEAAIDFGSNWNNVCSIVKTSPTTWTLRFNVIAFSCARPDTPFKFNIPVTIWYACFPNSFGQVSGSIPMLIC